MGTTQIKTTQVPAYEPMTDEEMEDYLDALYADWVSKQEAYLFEDNYEPFETKKIKRVRGDDYAR